MTDIVFIAVIVAFFVAAALLVRVIDRMIVGASEDVEAPEEDGAELEPGSR
jgi:flagellar biosynthesis/type III secretory pathway M-ring protein FliF/YscJ